MCNCHNDHTTLECPRYLKVNRPRWQTVDGPVEFLAELKARKMTVETYETINRLTLKNYDSQPSPKDNEYVTLYDVKKNGLPFIPLNIEKDTEVTGEGRLLFNTRLLINEETKAEHANEVLIVSDIKSGEIDAEFKNLKSYEFEIGEEENPANATVGSVYGDFAVHGRLTGTEEIAGNRLSISDHVEFGSVQSPDDAVLSNYLLTYFARYPLYGGTAEPELPNQFVTKKYVDEHSGGDAVHKTGNETVDGIKTFLTLPQSELTPTLDGEFITLKYFKDHGGGGGGHDPDAVHKTGHETIDGIKTFVTLPQSALTPSNDTDFTTKKYVDSQIPRGEFVKLYSEEKQNIIGGGLAVYDKTSYSTTLYGPLISIRGPELDSVDRADYSKSGIDIYGGESIQTMVDFRFRCGQDNATIGLLHSNTTEFEPYIRFDFRDYSTPKIREICFSQIPIVENTYVDPDKPNQLITREFAYSSFVPIQGDGTISLNENKNYSNIRFGSVELTYDTQGVTLDPSALTFTTAGERPRYFTIQSGYNTTEIVNLNDSFPDNKNFINLITGDQSRIEVSTNPVVYNVVENIEDDMLVTKRWVIEHGGGGGHDPDAVHKTGDEFISGVKIFNTLPQTSLAPTLDTEFANKKYVDEHGGGGGHDPDAVHKTGDESIDGVKTFVTLPVSEAEPSTKYQFVNKDYVDTTIPQMAIIKHSSDRQSITSPIYFSKVPECYEAPLKDDHLVNKQYVDQHPGKDPDAVHKKGDESIEGVKTFVTLPRTSLDPTQETEFVNKKYVDTVKQYVDDNCVKLTLDALQVINSPLRIDRDTTFSDRAVFVVAPTCQNSSDFKDDSLVTKQYVDEHSGGDAVHKTGDETIEGLKTFVTLPQSEATPTMPGDLITKRYLESYVPPEPTTGYLKLASLVPQTITEEVITFNNKCNYFTHYPEYSGDEGNPSEEKQFATVGFVQEYAGKKDSTGTQILTGILNWVLSQGAAYVTGKFFEGTSVAKLANDGISFLKEGVDKLVKGFGLSFIQKDVGLEKYLEGIISGPLYDGMDAPNSFIEIFGNESKGGLNLLARSQSTAADSLTSSMNINNDFIEIGTEKIVDGVKKKVVDYVFGENGYEAIYDPFEFGSNDVATCKTRMYKDESHIPCINLNATHNTDTSDINITPDLINLIQKTDNSTSVIGIHDRLITSVSKPNKPNTQARTESYIDESGFSVIKLDADTIQVTGPADSTFKIETARFHFYCRPQIDTSIPISSPAHVITSGECQNLINASMGAYIPKDLDVEVSSNKRLRLNPGIITFTSPGKLEFRNNEVEDHYTRIEADSADRLYIGCTKNIHINSGGTITSNKPWTVVNSNGKTNEGVTYEQNHGTKNMGGGLLLYYEEAKISFDLFKKGRPLSLILRRYQSQASDPGKFKDCLLVQEYNGDEVIVTESGWV